MKLKASFRVQTQEKLNSLETLVSEGRSTINAVADPSIRTLVQNSAAKAQIQAYGMTVEEKKELAKGGS